MDIQVSSNSRKRASVSMTARIAFSLIELVVVMVIVSIVASMMIVAVSKARESSRRVTCQNQLKQAALALQAFESRTGYLPDASGYESRKLRGSQDTVNAAIGSVWFQLRGELELTSRDTGRLRYQVVRRSDGEFIRTTLKLMSCPSDPQPSGVSYRVNGGAGASYFELDMANSEQSGPFSSGERLAFGKCTDGLSHTAFASEKRKGTINRRLEPDEFWLTGAGGLLRTPYTLDQFNELCRVNRASGSRSFYEFTGWDWRHPGLLSTVYLHSFAPGSNGIQDCLPQSRVLADSVNVHAGVVRASSFHVNGVNLAMLDGSVRMVENSVDLEIWRAWGTRAGDESPAETRP